MFDEKPMKEIEEDALMLSNMKAEMIERCAWLIAEMKSGVISNYEFVDRLEVLVEEYKKDLKLGSLSIDDSLKLLKHALRRSKKINKITGRLKRKKKEGDRAKMPPDIHRAEDGDLYQCENGDLYIMKEARWVQESKTKEAPGISVFFDKELGVHSANIICPGCGGGISFLGTEPERCINCGRILKDEEGSV